MICSSCSSLEPPAPKASLPFQMADIFVCFIWSNTIIVHRSTYTIFIQSFGNCSSCFTCPNHAMQPQLSGKEIQSNRAKQFHEPDSTNNREAFHRSSDSLHRWILHCVLRTDFFCPISVSAVFSIGVLCFIIILDSRIIGWRTEEQYLATGDPNSNSLLFSLYLVASNPKIVFTTDYYSIFYR